MKTISSSMTHTEKNNVPTIARPVIISLAFFLAVVILRYSETLVPGLAALPDKTIASRILGLLLVFVYIWALRKPIQSIGLHAGNFNKAFLIGGLSLIILYIVLYTIQFVRLNNAGETPQLVFAAINKKTGMLGGFSFTMVYLFGQIVNAIMEESIFRGVMLPNLMRRFKFWQANILQALLFGLAHLVFPFSDWLSGRATVGGAMADAGSLLIAATLGGLVYGYLFYRTGSLWTAIIAHFVDNAAILFFHIQTLTRTNAETDILMIASLGFLALVVLARAVAKHSNLPALEPWRVN